MTETAYLSRKEAAELSGASDSVINKALEQGLVASRQLRTGRRLDARDVGALALFDHLARAQLPLPVSYKRRLREWLRDRASAEITIAPGIVVRRLDEVQETIETASRYVEWRERFVETNPRIRGGEPVIRGTRVPIRGLAKQIEEGESRAVLREDYPNVPDDAFEFAVTWTRAHPRRGRPSGALRIDRDGEPSRRADRLCQRRRSSASSAPT